MSFANPHTAGPRLRPRLKLVWTDGRIKASWRWGLFGFYERIHGFPESGIAISGSRLLQAFLALTVLAYVAAAGALTVWFARSPHNRIGFVDVLTWPVRREHMARLRGQSWLAQGTVALREKRWAEGVFLLNRGLPLCPEDFEARLALAEFYVLSGQRPRGLALLEAPPEPFAPPKGWISRTLALLEAGEDWALVLRFCERGLARPATGVAWEERQTLLARQAGALIALDRAPEAIALAEKEGVGAGVDLKLQHALALLAQGRGEVAAALLGRWNAAAPAPVQPSFLRLRARVLRELGQFDQMDEALARLRALHPTRPEPLAYAVEQKLRAGRGGEAALADYIFRFGNKPAHLLLVGRPLAEIPATAAVRQLVAAARERGQPLRPVLTILAQALLHEGDWPALNRLMDELAPQFVGAEPEPRFWHLWMTTLTDALVSPIQATQDALVEFMQRGIVSLEARRFTLTALRRAERHATAGEVLAVSRKFFPASRSLRAEETALEQARAKAPAPVAVAAPTVEPRLQLSPAEFFQTVDDAIGSARWSEASEWLQKVRLARLAPVWVSAREGEILWRELQVAGGLRDAAALRIVAQLYVNSDSRAQEALKLARELHETGARDEAIVLAKAILRRRPEHNDAKAMLVRWQARPASGL